MSVPRQPVLGTSTERDGRMRVEVEDVGRRLLGETVARATVTGIVPIVYDPFLPGRSVDHVTGVAEFLDGSAAQWSAVLKGSRGHELRPARRELAAYRDGLTSHASVLRAPALLGACDDGDSLELWLEPLQDRYGGCWPIPQYGVSARDIGARDAAMVGVDPPSGFDSEDLWAERHGQPGRVDEALSALTALRRAPSAGTAMAGIDDDGFHRTERLIAGTVARIERLATFPTVLLHHDLVRSNLFALQNGSTAAIDWENVGRGPLGVDLAPLISGSVRRGEASADDIPVLEALVLDAYESGLEDHGVGSADVRNAYRLALALRWHVVLGTIRAFVGPAEPAGRGSRPREPRRESLHHLGALSRHLLDASDQVS